MGLETGNYITDLVATNPLGTDPKSAGDDHLRLIKNALKNCFAGFTGSIIMTGTDGGAANAYTLTSTPALLAYSTRMIAVFSPTADNTGASTLNISGLGVKDIKSVSGAALLAGELVSGIVYAAFYNGTEFRLLSITKGYADQLAFSAALPSQTGNAGKFITTNGTVASWTDTFTIPITFNSRLNEAKGADIASAATINLSTATGNLIHITGTTTITAITIPSGAERTLVFDGILTLTNGANLILPTGANITTAAGDSCKVRGDGAAARVISYTRADGTALTASRYALGLPIVLNPSVAVNVESLNFVTASNNGYLVEIESIRPNAGTDILLMRVANGGVVDTTAGNYFNAPMNGGNGSSASSVTLSSNVTSGSKGVSGKIDFQNINAVTPLKSIEVTTICDQGAPGPYTSITGVSAYIGAAISGLRFYWSGGASFAAQGAIRIYPIVNA